MTEKLFTAPRKITIPDNTPLLFLAGPVQGAPDWQTPLAKTLLLQMPEMAVASPRRIPHDQLSFAPEEQVSWEHRALDRARTFGILAFWLAAQDTTDPNYPKGRAYAQTTRIEFGKACGWKQFQSELPVVLGFDAAYTSHGGGSENYMRREAARYGIPVRESIADLADLVIAKADVLLQSESQAPPRASVVHK